ncbi:MAG: efflux RND transporter periplasmic adaptor subunit [Desulfobacterota bacterium]|nr:efflux RND transporter periplasmic adaptor subunit [Thermodesulfobacteriota bacterium]MDW8001724.1 efflux RND transporter periplasmic adaptor subunit [Deltaproteobacteria bacterium]
MKIRLVVILLLVLVGAGLTAYYTTAKRAEKSKNFEEEAQIRRGKIIHFTEQTGIIKAQVGAIVKVGTRATGEIVELPFQVGDYVPKGALIARIDDREIQANKRELEAQIEEQKKDIEAKLANYLYCEKNYERELVLLSHDLTTKDSVDRAKKELDMAKAQLELSKAKLKGLEEKLKALEVRLSYYSIYSPISGYVAEITTQKGETVVTGLSAVNLITIIDTRKLEMWIYVDETDIGRTKPGMRVEYWVDAHKDKKFRGKISTIYPQPQVMQNIVYYLAIVKIDPEYAKFLRPEMTTHVRIIIEEKENVVLCPNEAIRFEDGKYVVYVKKMGGIEKRPVVLGIRDERHTEILSGLEEGEIVLLTPKKQAPHSKLGVKKPGR